jgi:hypothetical protein
MRLIETGTCASSEIAFVELFVVVQQVRSCSDDCKAPQIHAASSSIGKAATYEVTRGAYTIT